MKITPLMKIRIDILNIKRFKNNEKNGFICLILKEDKIIHKITGSFNNLLEFHQWLLMNIQSKNVPNYTCRMNFYHKENNIIYLISWNDKLLETVIEIQKIYS